MKRHLFQVFFATAFFCGGCASHRLTDPNELHELWTGQRCDLILTNSGDYELNTISGRAGSEEDSSNVEAGRWSISGSIITLRSNQDSGVRRLRLTSIAGHSTLTDGGTLVLEKKVYRRLSPKEVEEAFSRLQQVKLPLPWIDAWRALGLPEEEKLESDGHMGGPSGFDFSRWILTAPQAGGSY
jgi:hypothetical protein